MKKRTLTLLLMLVVSLVSIVGLTACEVDTHEHTMQKTEAIAATCTEVGNIEYYTCTDCGNLFADEKGETEITAESTVVAAKGHTIVAVNAKEATCTEDGNTAHYKCSVCGKLFSDEEGTTEITAESTVVEANGHTIVAVNAKEATCTEDGNTAHYKCSVCEKLFSDEEGATEITVDSTVIAKEGHAMTHHEAVPATCTEDGTLEYYSCSRCNKNFADENGTTEKTSTVDVKKGHEMTHHDAVAATCTEDGNVEYYSCSRCNKNFANENGETGLNEIKDPAKGHTYTLVPEVAKTCTTDGTKAHYVCNNDGCGKKFLLDGEEYKEATDMDLIIYASHEITKIEAKAETCTEDGNTAYYACSACGKYFSDEDGNTEIKANSWVIAAHHTYEETLSHDETSHWYACKNCDDKKDETDHTYGDATFDSIGGSGTHTCTECEYEEAVVDNVFDTDFTKTLYGAVAYTNADNEKKAVNAGAAKNATDYKTRFGFDVSNGAIGYVVPASSSTGVTEACFPKINYSAFAEVSLKVIMRATGNGWKLGLDVTDMRAVSMPSSTVSNSHELAMLIKNRNGALIVTIKTDASTTLTKTTTDEKVINGLASLSVFVSGTFTNGVEICDFNFKTLCEEHTYGEATSWAIGKTVQTCSVCGYENYQNAEVGELDFTANKLGAKAMWQVNGAFTLHDGAVKSSTELAASDGTISKDSLAYIAAAQRLYEDYLPRINFAAFKKVTINFSVQKNTDKWNLGLSADSVVQITYEEGTTTGEATLTFEMQGDKLVQTLTVNGATYTKEITNSAVINGEESATFYVQDATGRGVFYLSDFTFEK